MHAVVSAGGEVDVRAGSLGSFILFGMFYLPDMVRSQSIVT